MKKNRLTLISILSITFFSVLLNASKTDVRDWINQNTTEGHTIEITYHTFGSPHLVIQKWHMKEGRDGRSYHMGYMIRLDDGRLINIDSIRVRPDNEHFLEITFGARKYLVFIPTGLFYDRGFHEILSVNRKENTLQVRDGHTFEIVHFYDLTTLKISKH